MAAGINQISAIHDIYAVGTHGGGDALRYNDLCFPHDRLIECASQLFLGQKVQSREAVVKDVDRRGLDHGARDAQALFLTAGQLFAGLTDLVIHALRAGFDEICDL